MKTFHKPIPILSLFAMLLLFVWACRKEKPEFDLSDKDPCSCASEVSADFEIYEIKHMPFNQGLNTLTDDIVGNSTVRFNALIDDAEYTWYIGSEVLHSQSVTRFFTPDLIGQTVPITLVVNKTPNSTCFPNDTGHDSITKYVTIHSACDQHPLSGFFRFAEANSTDSIDMEIVQTQYISTNDCENFAIYNFDNQEGYCSGQYHRFLINYREIKTIDQSTIEESCPKRVRVFLMRYEFDGSIFLDMRYRTGLTLPDESQETVRKQYYGRKLL